MTEVRKGGEKNQPVSIVFPKNYSQAVDMIGNPDDYRPIDRTVQKVNLDRKEIKPDDDDTSFDVATLTTFEGEKLATHSAADQLAFILNTEVFGNSVGKDGCGFYGQTVHSSKVAQSYPEVTPLANPGMFTDSVLCFKPDAETEGIPLVAILNAPQTQGEDSKYPVEHVWIAWLESSKKLDSLSRKNLATAISTYCKKGFPSLTELTNLDGSKFKNPISSSGGNNQDREFYSSDEQAMELREKVLDLLAALQDSFDSKNESGSLISDIDQLAQTLFDRAKEMGIDLNTFSPSAMNQELFTPLNQVAMVAWSLIHDMFDVTRIDTNYDEATQGQSLVSPDTNLAQGVDDLGVSKEKLTQKQLNAISIDNMLRYCEDRLAVTSNEMSHRRS